MKYYLVEITRYVEPVSGKTESVGIYTYDSETAARANFHSKMGGAMKNDNYAMELLFVKNEYGVDIAVERYEKHVEAPAEE